MAHFIKLLFISLLFVLIIVTPVNAHNSLSGATFADGSHLIMFTYNIQEPQARIPIRYNFRIYELLTGKPIPFDYVNIRFTRDTTVVTERKLTMSKNLDAIFYWSFPKQGNYTITLHFIDNGKLIAEAQFPLAVKKGLYEGISPSIITIHSLSAFALGGLIVGLLATKPPFVKRMYELVTKYRRKKK